ncbi:MAG: EAL domain-containing protein [Pseudomonadota bacterium]
MSPSNGPRTAAKAPLDQPRSQRVRESQAAAPPRAASPKPSAPGALPIPEPQDGTQALTAALKQATDAMAAAGGTAGASTPAGSGQAKATPSATDIAHNRYAVAIDYMAQGLCMFDADQRVVVANAQYAQLYGLTLDDVRPGTHLQTILERRIAKGLYSGDDPRHYARERLREVTHKSTSVMTLSDGRTIQIVQQPIVGGYWVTTHEDITQRRRTEAQIAHLAAHDTLTGLPNRQSLHRNLEKALAHVSRGAQLALLFVNLDGFRSINDAHGHDHGDELLREIAKRLRTNLRETDVIARLGVDEFAIIQSRVSQPQDAATLAERLLELISVPVLVRGARLVMNASIGIVLADGRYPDEAAQARVSRSHTTMMSYADLALQRAKTDGGHCYRFFDPRLDARMRERRALGRDVKQAVERDELEVHYQPIIDLPTRRVAAFEALVRWRHRERGMIAPGDFIPLAEANGAIVPIGEWVMQQAAKDAATWPEDVAVTVNVSAAQFATGSLIETIQRALRDSGLAAHRLEIEITESLLLQNSSATLALLQQVKACGASISMDDFGTGFSSLGSLAGFPFDKIKIDRAFIKDLPHAERSLAILRSVTGLGRALRMATTAEGIQTVEQLRLVEAEGCSQAQGFLFSRPVEAARVPALLESLSAVA